MAVGRLFVRFFRQATGLALGAIFLTVAPVPTPARDVPNSAATRLEALNTDFRSLYQERTRQVLENQPLVLVVQNSGITAIRGQQQQTYPVALTHYTEIKSISHAVLGFHGLMMQLVQAGDGAVWNRAEHFLANLEALHGTLTQTVLDTTEQQQVNLLLEALEQTTRHALATRQITPDVVKATLQSTRPVIDALVISAGQRHVLAMQKTLDQIKASVTAEEWAAAIAVVTGPMTPRRNNLETAVVASALGTANLGTRIFYAENIFSIDGALAYLQTVLGDRELSVHVFDDPYRMWQDLFSPVSRTLVDDSFYTELHP